MLNFFSSFTFPLLPQNSFPLSLPLSLPFLCTSDSALSSHLPLFLYCSKMLETYRTRSIDWKPSPIVALATSFDNSQVAAARDDGSLEIWLVSPGSVGWHCQLTIHGNTNSRVSSLVWCCAGPFGRLFSSSIDGSVSEWDLFHSKQKTVLESIGVSIWQMAIAPHKNQHHVMEPKVQLGNGKLENGVGDDSSEDEDDSDYSEHHEESALENACVALACDDGCVRLYTVSQLDMLTYSKSLPRVSGRILSVAWSADASTVYSGSSDGLIRCWNAKTYHEIYRITVGHEGVGRRSELCIWSLLALRSGTLVSADSSGSVQFWDSIHGTLLQAHSFHKGDVNALAAAPSHNRVFSAGSDGQVILYKLSGEKAGSTGEESLAEESKKWVYVGSVRAHTHDIRSLTVAVPISCEDPLTHEHVKRIRRKKKPIDFSYRKWAHMGVPMLVSAGDDTKLFAYSIQEFSKFSPHDICPAPQRLPMQLVLHSALNQKILLVQNPCWLDILCVWTKHAIPLASSSGNSGGCAGTELLVRVKSKVSRRIICSTISNSGEYFAYSDNVKPSLFELTRRGGDKGAFIVNKKQLPQRLSSAHAMVFSFDSSRLIMAGNDQKISVVDVGSSELLHTFKPCREELSQESPSDEPPITRMFASSDGQWLAAVNCFGDVYVYNLEIQRQHWFISRLDGASVTAGGFPPSNNNVLILTTSSNQVYAFDVEAKQLGEWSVNNTFTLPKRYQEFPGEVIGLSFPPSTSSSSVVIYSARAMCVIDFGIPGEGDGNHDLMNGVDPGLRKVHNGPVNGNLKRRLKDCEVDTKLGRRKNFEFFAFRDPVLFIGHLSKNSILIMEKPWLEVVKKLEAAPIHRHIFGT